MRLSLIVAAALVGLAGAFSTAEQGLLQGGPAAAPAAKPAAGAAAKSGAAPGALRGSDDKYLGELKDVVELQKKIGQLDAFEDDVPKLIAEKEKLEALHKSKRILLAEVENKVADAQAQLSKASSQKNALAEEMRSLDQGIKALGEKIQRVKKQRWAAALKAESKTYKEVANKVIDEAKDVSKVRQATDLSAALVDKEAAALEKKEHKDVSDALLGVHGKKVNVPVKLNAPAPAAPAAPGAKAPGAKAPGAKAPGAPPHP